MLSSVKVTAVQQCLAGIISLFLLGCGGGCPTAADRDVDTLLDVHGTVAPGGELSWEIDNGILPGNLSIFLTWADLSVSLELVTTAMDCGQTGLGACDQFRFQPTGADDYEISVDASSVPKYRVTVVGDPENESSFHLTVTYWEAICT